MIKKLIASAFAAVLWSSAAVAQSGCPTIVYGAVLTAGQWNACFAAKQNTLGYTPLPITGGVMTGPLGTAASTTLKSGLNIPTGVAPTSPVNGDVWTTAAGIYVRINGVTIGPLSGATSSSFAATLPLAVTFPSGVVTFALNYDSNFVLSGSNLALASIAAGSLIANSTSGSAEPTGTTLTALIDRAVGSTRGSIIERGASAWGPIVPGTTAYPFVSNGSGSDPAYQQLTGAGIAANTVANSNFRQSAALSLVGNATAAPANVADITASGAYQAFRVDATGSTIGFGALDVSQANAVTGLLRAGSFPILTGAISTVGGSLTTTLVTAQPDAHTWAATQTFTVAPVFTDQSGSRTALGLGTMATQNAASVAITGGTVAGLTGLGIRDTSAAFDLTIAATSSTPLSAGRTLTFDVVNAARTVKLGANLTIASDPGAVTGAIKSNGTGTFAQAASTDLSNTANIPLLNAANAWSNTNTLQTLLAGTTNTYDVGTSATVSAFRTIYAGTSFVGPTHTATTAVGTPILAPLTDSTTALQITKADKSTRIMDFDTTNARVGINKTPGAFDLDVNGAVNVGGAITLAVTGSTQCLQVNSAGLVAGTGSSCGAAGAALLSGSVLSKTAGYTLLTGDCGSSINLSGGIFTITLGAASGYASNCGFLLTNAATETRAKYISPNGLTSFYLYPGQSVIVSNQSNVWVVGPQLGRWRVAGTVNFYVRPDGADGGATNDGLDNSAAGAFLTASYAAERVALDVDLNGQTVNINHTCSTPGSCTITAASQLMNVVTGHQFVGGYPHYRGDGCASLASATILAPSTAVQADIQFTFDSKIGICGFKLAGGANTSYGMYVSGQARVILDGLMEFGNSTNGILLNSQAQMDLAANFTVSSSLGYVLSAQHLAFIENSGSMTITVTGTPAWGNAFVYAYGQGTVQINPFIVTITGAATGGKANIQYNGFVDTASNACAVFPGTGVVTATGGQCY